MVVRAVLPALTAAATLAATPAAPAAAASKVTTTTARVVTVLDGDTVQVRERGRLRTIALIGADAPEGFACGAKPARDALVRLLPVGAKVRLRRDRAARSSSRYVFRGGRHVNALLVRAGHAVLTGSKKLTRRAELRDAERAARSRGRGVWSSCPAPSAPVPAPAPETVPGAPLTGEDAVARARAELSGVLFAGTGSSGASTAETRLHLCGDGYAALDTTLANKDINLELRNRIEGTWEVLSAAYADTSATATVRLSSSAGTTTVTLASADGRFTIDGAEVPSVLRSDVCTARPGGV